MAAGVALDGLGQPWPGLLPSAGSATSRTGTDGTFAVPVAAVEQRVLAADAALATMPEGVVPAAAKASTSLVVVIGRAVRVLGRVVDERGAAVAGATVTVRPTADFLQLVHVPIDQSRPAWTAWRAEADRDGAFELARVVFVPGAVIEARAPNLRPAAIPLPERGGDACDVVAMQRGHLPARRPLPPAGADGTLPPIELRLGAPPLPLPGTVIDRDGRPVPAVRVPGPAAPRAAAAAATRTAR
jgi:hypothetical protein